MTVEEKSRVDYLRSIGLGYKKIAQKTGLSESKVLKMYGNRCAICRCNIIETLQAAHEHGFEPNEANKDDPTHGICLCANHHLMYDRNLLSIDFKKQKVSFLNSKIEENPLNKIFMTEYNRRRSCLAGGFIEQY